MHHAGWYAWSCAAAIAAEEAIMVSGKEIFPLAMTVSSGSSGVSAPFSVLPEKWTEHTGALGQAMIQLMAAPRGEHKEAARVISQHITETVGQIYNDANSSAQSINAIITEAVRLNFEQTMRFLEDFANAKGPADAIGLQFGFFDAQARLFAHQSKIMQQELAKMFLPKGVKPGQRPGN
jgi:Phasin protein